MLKLAKIIQIMLRLYLKKDDVNDQKIESKELYNDWVKNI